MPTARRSAPLTATRQFAVTWGIPDDFGGMTRALLARSAAFARRGAPVDVLTFDGRADYPEVERRLRERGELAEGVRLVDLFAWLRENPLPGGSLCLGRDAFTPLDPGDPSVAPDPRTEATWMRGGRPMRRVRRAEDGTILQVDHLRADGTLLLTDRRDTRQPGTVGGRSIVLCDATGTPVRSWNRARWLYHAWLDALVARRPSTMIIDSKTCAGFLWDYRRRSVTTIHLVHNSHLAHAEDPFGGVRASRRTAFEHLEGFDAVAVLTERQRDDIVASRGPARNLVVLPNAVDPGPVVGVARDPALVVVLASLTERKRVDHAVRAVLAAAHGLHLDVWGEGSGRAGLEALLAGHPSAGAVALRGHRPDARAEFDRASAVLVTGDSEGFPLVLIEAMAHGCVPIAYDVRYGPADLIQDGRNGLLVPSGDERGLARALERLAEMPPERVAALRREAQRAARRYSEDAVIARWEREIDAARRRHSRELAPPLAPLGVRAVRRLRRTLLRRAG